MFLSNINFHGYLIILCYKSNLSIYMYDFFSFKINIRSLKQYIHVNDLKYKQLGQLGIRNAFNARAQVVTTMWYVYKYNIIYVVQHRRRRT